MFFRRKAVDAVREPEKSTKDGRDEKYARKEKEKQEAREKHERRQKGKEQLEERRRQTLAELG